jgi:hypothetical protein
MKQKILVRAITTHIIYLQLSTTTTPNVTPVDQLVLLFEKTQEGKSLLRYTYTVELYLSGPWLSGSASPFGWICPEFYTTNLLWNYRLSDQVQYSVMASRTSNQAWSKSLDAGTHCPTVTAELQTANIAYFRRKILFFGFSAYPNSSSSKLNRISWVLLHFIFCNMLKHGVRTVITRKRCKGLYFKQVSLDSTFFDLLSTS